MNINLNEVKVLKHFSSIIPKIIQDVYKRNKKGKYVETRPFRYEEKYAISVFLAISEVYQTLQKLNQAIIYLTNYRVTPSLKKEGINRFSHIEYHLENYFIRTQSVYDKMLVVLNEVFRLGNAEENCIPKTIFTDSRLQGNRIISLMKDLRKILNKFRGPRDEIIHRIRYYREDKLARVGNLYIIGESDIKSISPADFKIMRTIITNEYLKNKKRELNKTNNAILNIIEKIFDEVVIEFDKQYPLLVNYKPANISIVEIRKY